MMTITQKLQNTFSESAAFQSLRKTLQHNHHAAIKGAAGSAKAFILASLFNAESSSVLVIMRDEKEARLFNEDLTALLGSEQVQYFPAFSRQLWSELGPSSPLVGLRIRTLKALTNNEKNIFIAPAQAVMEKVAQSRDIQDKKILLKTGEKYQFEQLIKQLVDAGYEREDRVDRPGEVSIRGGIVDIFLFEELNPWRIEFFGDEIESIREFEIESQKSVKKAESLAIYPLDSAGFYGPDDDHPITALQLKSSIVDFLDKDTLICFIDFMSVQSQMMDYEEDMTFRMEAFAHEHKITNLQYVNYYTSATGTLKALDRFKKIEFPFLQETFSTIVDMGITWSPDFGGKFDHFKGEIANEIKKHPDHNLSIYYCCDSETQLNRITDLLKQEDFPDLVKVTLLNISEGFQWPDKNLYLYTNKEVYSKPKHPKLDKIEQRPVSMRELAAIQYGDFVVHDEHGIGIFRGLKKINAYGKDRECIILEYLDGDTLYVPLEKMHLVKKYSGKEGFVPQLNKLGTKTWEKLKSKTKENIKEVAAKLIKLYATRKMRPGYSFAEDSIWLKELEASFEYEETLDQLNAIEDIKKDMQLPRPMDRLVCGDVGFGKTEVAIRAAFKAVDSGKQVAILVPTTILAQQHYNTFSDRLRQFPVTTEMLSRFRTPAQQKEIVNRMAKGKVDIIVGTHRLLSKDIKFNDLGLLVIDEEQRFGVMHKEKLKLLKESVDTLSLSATPIPRTMHMALMGAKDMSIINTPPHNRMPIKTEVARFDRDFIREIILKEIDRGGQVFFVHNRVQSIYGIAGLIREIVPEIEIAVAHGQMSPHQLEEVMLSFAKKKIQCLICTMIIESGIDMPNANTLIINRADKFGLAQLYQLRGRVGRSNLQGYAYLLVPPLRRLTRIAIKRLQTIQELSQLGSGYKVAMRDLEIRGTGNIFGPQQSGFVDALGYDVYSKIIEEAIQELKQEISGEPKKEEAPLFEPIIEMKIDAYLPEDYICNPSERVDIYRRLIEAKTVEKIDELEREVLDRFGRLPEKAQTLVDYVLIKMLAQKALISRLSLNGNIIIGKFATEYLPKGEQFRSWIGTIVQKSSENLELKPKGNDIIFEILVPRHQNQIKTAKNFLQSII